MTSHIYAAIKKLVDGSTQPKSCLSCCGIGYYHAWTKLGPSLECTDAYLRNCCYVPIDEFTPGYTGILYATFNKTTVNLDALEEIRKYHTIQYETDWVINTSPVADEGGRTGVKMIIFKIGK